MAKVRVHEIAKELGKSSKEMVEILQKLGLEVKNHMSTMEESQASWVRKQLAEKDNHQRRPEQKPAAESSTKTKSDIKAEQARPNVAAPQPPDRRTPKSERPPQTRRSPQGDPQAQGRQQPQPKAQTQDKGPAQQKQQPQGGRPPQRQQPQGGRPPQRQQPQGGRPPQKQQPQGGRPQNRIQPATPITDRNANQLRPQEQRGAERPKPPVGAPRAPKPTSAEEKGAVRSNKLAPASKAGQSAPKKGGERTVNRFAQNQPRRDYSRPQRKSKHKRRKEETILPPPEAITIDASITVRDLAEQLRRSSAEIVKRLMELGVMASINQPIDFETAEIVASLYEVRVDRAISEEEKILEEIVDSDESLVPRPPVVTVMGHVDHGKTSLLDRIRKADVVSGEAGGITQHIGAYQVKVNENRITFIDTPGHEAFTAMRARGANLTDIVILVVAADDGVMPQTVEAISHIRAADVPFLVAVNKIDKPSANPERVMQQLTEYNIVPEEWGGDTIFVPLSAKTGEGIENLLEMVLLVAEVNDIKSNPDRPAEGVVIEGKLDKGRGPVATVLVQKGTLRIGDYILSGSSLCKVRAMTDHRSTRVETAYPSMPVEITGWSEPPEAGGRVLVCDEKVAKEVISLRLTEKKIEEQKQSSRVSLDDFFKHIQENELKELRLIIKGDVQGSVEALSQSLLRLSTPEVKVTVLHSGVGAVTESDVMLASTSNAIIIGFNVRPDSKARKYAEDEHIDVRLYRVIYEAIDEVKKAMAGLLEPEYREKFLGRAAVRATFKVPNIGLIAGCYVTEGKFLRNAEMRVLRDGIIIYEGKLSSLKRFKDDVKEVAEGYECGMGIKDFNDIKDGDIIEAFTIEEIPREL
jgi:translation initiation factor IF-2